MEGAQPDRTVAGPGARGAIASSFLYRALLLLLGLGSVLPLSAAGAALVGLGIVRGLGAGPIAVTASLLLVLPVTGLWAAMGRSQPALILAMYFWPSLLLAGLPGYFPEELEDAITTGYAVFAAPGGTDLAVEAARLGGRIASPIGLLPQGTTPPPTARVATVDCPPASSITSGDQVALPYEGRGQSLAIPIQVDDAEFFMLFDTGASLTTLNGARLRRLGLHVAPDAPTVALRTANGPRSARLVLLPEIWVGGFAVQGVTVGVCEECADEDVSGLLGLNVSGQFLVTIDTVRKEVVLQQRTGVADRLLDVAPWLDVEATAAIFPDQRVDVTVRGDNRSTRVVRSAKVGVSCGAEKFIVELSDVPAGGVASGRASLPRGTVCDAYKVTLEGAEW